MIRAVALFALVSGELFAAPALANGGADRLLADMGRVYFARHCAACHGPEARGDGPAAAALQPRPPDLTELAIRRGGRFPDGEIARFIDGRFEVIAHGSRQMPVWGERFSEGVPEPGVGDQIARGKIVMLVEYLKSIQRSSSIGPAE